MRIMTAVVTNEQRRKKARKGCQKDVIVFE